MAFDEVLIQRVEKGLSEPCVRFYTWDPWCITLGSFQAADEQLQLDTVHAAGFDVVKRPTGGRAVFHAQELTYTICAPKNFAPWGKTLGLTYDWIAEQLLAGLEDVGFRGTLERGDVGALERSNERHLVKPPCFSSASRAEIVWEGRKLVGSAQRRTRNAFLQHGSILLGDAHLGIVDFLDFPAEHKAQIREELNRHSVSLSAIAGVDSRLDSVLGCMQARFRMALGAIDSEPTLDELTETENLLRITP
jgi:lipoate-protein ligase A